MQSKIEERETALKQLLAACGAIDAAGSTRAQIAPDLRKALFEAMVRASAALSAP